MFVFFFLNNCSYSVKSDVRRKGLIYCAMEGCTIFIFPFIFLIFVMCVTCNVIPTTASESPTDHTEPIQRPISFYLVSLLMYATLSI